MKKKFLIVAIVLMSYQCYDKSEKELVVSDASEIENAVESQIDKTNVSIVKDEAIVNSQIEQIQKELNREQLVEFAKTFIGTPYVYATQDPDVGFDCSGYINYIYKNYDIIVPRSSSGFKDFGKRVDIEEVKLGDVLVFKGYQDSTVIGHLGIVCEANGLNSKFVHATSGKAMQVTISDLNSTHYSNRFHHATDVIAK